MGLFIAPTSGNAVGGGGHNLGDPPPPGIDVDTVNRLPLRLLRRTMNKHVPKRLNIVPPGQQRGMLAPPYAWDAVERDDWKYETPKPKSCDEAEFQSSKPHAPPHPAPLHPAAPHPDNPDPETPDPRHARVDAIKAELAQLRTQLQQLVVHQRGLTQAGKSSLVERPKFQPSPTVQVGRRELVSLPPPVAEEFEREEPDADREARMKRHVPGPADQAGGMRWVQKLDRQRDQPIGLRASGSKERRQVRKADSERLILQRHHDQEKRQHAKPPTQSREIIAVHQQIDQKHRQIALLVDELKQIRMQMKQTHESYRLISNNLCRLSLLLK